MSLSLTKPLLADTVILFSMGPLGLQSRRLRKLMIKFRPPLLKKTFQAPQSLNPQLWLHHCQTKHRLDPQLGASLQDCLRGQFLMRELPLTLQHHALQHHASDAPKLRPCLRDEFKPYQSQSWSPLYMKPPLPRFQLAQ